ncbi:hypothetical protein CG006_01690 [Mesoplasma florum]|uniref:hypothetical protein n=1 Tax=Mesoplasma florum TaxID=2151 RepID=UPI000D0261F0|nr:hypothetical protein [Mesoplasma florum]AVN63690.1 hypothetical protein CG006_01690 [Mesoplasma florum]
MKKLLSLLSAIGIASSGSVLTANTINIKQINNENVEIIEDLNEGQTGPEINVNTIKVSDAISKIKQTAEKQTYVSINEAIEAIQKETLVGTEVSLEKSEYIVREENKINGLVHLNLALTLKKDYTWDNESLESTLYVSTIAKIDERINVDKNEVLAKFKELSSTIPEGEGKVEHKKYFKSKNEALLEILQTEFEYGQVTNAIIKSASNDEEKVINDDIEFEVEVLLDKNHKWLNEVEGEKTMNLNTFNFDLKIDERKEASFNELNTDIINKLGKNNIKFYSEQEALDAIEKYKTESNIESIKDGGVSLDVKENDISSQIHSIYDKEFIIEAKIDEKIYKWSDETTLTKEINLLTLIDSRIQVKQNLVENQLKDAVEGKVFASQGELVQAILDTSLEEGATVLNIKINVVDDETNIQVIVAIDGEYRWDIKDDSNEPLTFEIKSKVYDNRVDFSEAAKSLSNTFKTESFANKEEIEVFVEKQKVNGIDIEFVDANGSQEKGWIINLILTPNKNMTWSDGTNSSQKLMVTAKAAK